MRNRFAHRILHISERKRKQMIEGICENCEAPDAYCEFCEMRKKYFKMNHELNKKQNNIFLIVLFIFVIILANPFDEQFFMGLLFGILIILFTFAFLDLRKNKYKLIEVAFYVAVFIVIMVKLY